MKKTKDDVVVPANNELLQEIVIVMISEDQEHFVVSCIQKRNKKVTIRNNKLNNADKNLSVLCEIETKPNAKNVWHRFKDYVFENQLSKQIKLSTHSFTLTEYNSMSTTDIVSLFEELSKIHVDRVVGLTI